MLKILRKDKGKNVKLLRVEYNKEAKKALKVPYMRELRGRIKVSEGEGGDLMFEVVNFPSKLPDDVPAKTVFSLIFL